ncbi:MAG: hypothetical protein JO015_07500 [Verrucomicrobia bacterium]|nr:hypothetical protein [Verrucomicrobiota bacterium]
MPPVSVKDFQELLERLEASRQSRLRAWDALQRLRAVLAEHGRRDLPQPARKTFEREGQILEINLKEALEDRNRALRDLCKAVRRFQTALLDDSKAEQRHTAQQAMLKALSRAEDLAG